MPARSRTLSVLAAVALVGAAAGASSASAGTDSTTPSDDTAADTTAGSMAMADTTVDTTVGSDATVADSVAEAEAESPPTTAYVPPERGDADLVIWADEVRADAIRPLADAFAADEGITVVVQEVPNDKLRENMSQAAPAGEGPDIIVGAHDWLGELVSNGVLEPIDLGDSADDYAEVATQAFSFDGQTYGLPYAVENIALIRNTDLVPEAPATFEDLEATALQLVADGEATVPLAIQEDEGAPYHNYPLFSALGGYVFGQNDDGSYDPSDVGIDSEGGLRAAEAFAAWSEEGLISKDITYDVMIDSFASGEAPFAITGPWAVSDPDRGFAQSGVNFVVEPIPPVDGGTPQVFVGVQGFMISSFSENIDLAKSFLLDYMNTEDAQLALFDAGGRPPAMLSAFESVANDPVIEGFGLSGQQGVPQPAIPEMGAVWDTWKNAYSLIFNGADPNQAFTDAAAAIRADIAS